MAEVNPEPIIQITNRYHVDEKCADLVWDDDGELIDDPVGVSGLWQVEVSATFSSGSRERSYSRNDCLPMSLSKIAVATSTLREAIATLDPPVVLDEWDPRITVDSMYEDNWSPGLSSRAVVDTFDVVIAIFEQRYNANQDVPKVTDDGAMPRLVLGIDF